MTLHTIGRQEKKILSLMQIHEELLAEDDFKDVTLVSDDLHVVKAHKALLSKSSDVFRQLLMLQDDKDPIVFIRGSSQKQLKALLTFIYLGETEVTEEDMKSFFELAEYFKVKGFTDREKELSGTLKNQNIVSKKVILQAKGQNIEHKKVNGISMGEEATEDDSYNPNSELCDLENVQGNRETIQKPKMCWCEYDSCSGYFKNEKDRILHYIDSHPYDVKVVGDPLHLNVSDNIQ